MDPQVLAAIVSSAAVLVAAAAAWAAGRHQARGAHLGPVDADRRQHQRGAYAAFLEAADTYANKTQHGQCLMRAHQESPDLDEHIDQRARDLRARAAEEIDDMRRTLPVVQLEGPDDIAELALLVFNAALAVRLMAQADALPSRVTVQRDRDEHDELTDSITAYVSAARAYLNNYSTNRRNRT